MKIDLMKFAEHTVFWCSVASPILPPIEKFREYPRFQKFYAKLVKGVTIYGSLNLRNTLHWKSFDTARPDPPKAKTLVERIEELNKED